MTLAEQLSELWDAERCSWSLEYEPAMYHAKGTFRLDLEWADDRDTPHKADWATYTWQFYADTADEAISDAVAFCEGLLPFKVCPACGGRGGYYRTAEDEVPCEECEGTGLANRPPKAPAERSIPDLVAALEESLAVAKAKSAATHNQDGSAS